jgi:MFS family permease
MTDRPTGVGVVPRTLTRRLLPLQVGTGLLGVMLWVPVEKLFQTQIGFDAASIGVMAAAYAAVVPLLEVPSGILADRWSRTGLLVVSAVAAAASALLGGASHDVATYIAAAMILGIYFATSSGTVDSVVYDTVVEETGSADLYEKVIGRVRVVESLALASSAVAGGLIAGWTSPRTTYLLTLPFALAAVVAFLRFREPQLHRVAEPVSLRRHVATTVGAMTRIPQVRQMLLLAALTALLSQAVFEFGPLWLVELQAPAAAYGPYWALLVATLGLGGYLAGKLHLDRGAPVVILAVLLAATPILLATSRVLLVVVLSQTLIALLLAVIGIHAGRLLHDAVPSTIRAGVSSGAGTFSWLLFLPFSLIFGALTRAHGVAAAGWVLAGVIAVLALLLVVSTRTARTVPLEVEAAVDEVVEEVVDPPTRAAPADLACRELVGIVSDYVDGVLPADWRARADEHLRACDGCTAYLQQIRATVDLLTRLNAQTDCAATSHVPARRAAGDDQPST